MALSLNGSSSYLGLALGGAVGGLALANGSEPKVLLVAVGFTVFALVAIGLTAGLLKEGSTTAGERDERSERGTGRSVAG